MKTEWLMVV